MVLQARARTSRLMLLLIASGIFLTMATGCQQYARITWDTPKPVELENRTPLAVGDLSKLNRQAQPYEGHPQGETIGKHTFTLFAIPVGNINADQTTPLKESFDKAVRDALQAAGYDLVEAPKAPANSPVLRGEVRSCWWWSYSWTWPFSLQGGENKIALFLEKPDGAVLWQHEFSRGEPGVAMGGAYGFDSMIKKSMTNLLRDVVHECSAEEFKAALRSR